MTIGGTSRGTYRNEHGVDTVESLYDVGRKIETAVMDVRRDKRFKPRLPYRNSPGDQSGDLCLVLVDAGYLMAEVCEAGPGYQPDITGSDYSDPHGFASSLGAGKVTRRSMPSAAFELRRNGSARPFRNGRTSGRTTAA